MLDDEPAVRLERVVEQRPVGSDVGTQVVGIDAVELRRPALGLRELGGTRSVIWDNEAIRVFVVPDADSYRGIELPDAIEELFPELPLEGPICRCLRQSIDADDDQRHR